MKQRLLKFFGGTTFGGNAICLSNHTPTILLSYTHIWCYNVQFKMKNHQTKMYIVCLKIVDREFWKGILEGNEDVVVNNGQWTCCMNEKSIAFGKNTW